MPLVGYHPVVHGQHVSARDPDILAGQGLGQVFRATSQTGNLDAEAWFDKLLTEAFDLRLNVEDRMLPRVMRGEPIELSTGLFTDNTPAPDGATFDGKPYTYVARNYKPDHVAVLPDQVGACSLKDGCGISVNSNEDTMKGQLVTWLVTNCACWKGKDAVLNAMTEDDLKAFKATAEKAQGDAKVATILTNAKAAAEGDDPTALLDWIKNSPADIQAHMCGMMKNAIMGQPAAPPAAAAPQNIDPAKPPTPDAPPATPPGVPPPPDDKKPNMPPTGNRQLTPAEFKATLPPGMRAMWDSMEATHNAKKAELVGRLTVNIAGDKTAHERFFMAKELPELEMLASLVPPPVANNTFPNFLGAVGGTPPTTNGAKPDLGAPMSVPTINWAEEATNQRKHGR